MSKLFLKENEIRKLLSLAAASPRDFALFNLALSTGFRVSDLLRIKRADLIDSDARICRAVRLKMKKTKKYIERPLRDDCREAIATYLKSRRDNNPYLFRPEANNSQRSRLPMNRSSIHRIYKEYLGRLVSKQDLRGNSCHTTRRSVASLISERSGRVEPATKFLGHSSIASTLHYLDQDEFSKKADEIIADLPW